MPENFFSIFSQCRVLRIIDLNFLKDNLAYNMPVFKHNLMINPTRKKNL